MQLNVIIGPILGAIIGYVTNKIAVEMLFHPLNPIYIGKFHVPFTPGIIPKGKDRLGKSIGEAVGSNLLTPAVLKETLLSEEIELEIANQVDEMIHNLSISDTSIDTNINLLLTESTMAHLEENTLSVISTKVSTGLKSMNLGDLVAEEVITAVQDKVDGTMFSFVVKPSTIAPITDEIKVRVNQYVDDHSEDMIRNYMQNELTTIKGQPISSFFQTIDTTEIKQTIIHLYRMLVNNYAEKFLSSLNLSKIVEEKVSAMDTKEVEKLVLSIMEKELGAVVNLGAVIGFLLGLFNLLF